MSLQNVTVFCGSAMGNRAAYEAAAARLGETLAKRGIGLVYGAGARGLMGVVAQAVKENGGRAVGINLSRFLGNAKYLMDVDENIVTETIQERKFQLIERGDACIALPGGIGTLDEIAEIYSMAQLGLSDKPFALYNVGGFFDGLVAFFEHAIQEGFIKPKYRDTLIVSDDLDEILERLEARAC